LLYSIIELFVKFKRVVIRSLVIIYHTWILSLFFGLLTLFLILIRLNIRIFLFRN